MVQFDEKAALCIIALMSLVLNLILLWELHTADADFEEMVDFYESQLDDD